MIKAFERRNIEAQYYPTQSQALDEILKMVPENSTVSWGGSMTIQDIGLLDALRRGSYTCLDRDTAKTPEESRELFRKTFSADFFFLSSNAITMDGKLVNIDGRGTRLAPFIYGPSRVIVVAGMNKVVKDEEAAISRVKHYASPVNVKRLKQNTPCAKSGECEDCLSKECICTHTVVTRRSHEPGRLTVVLIGEELGY